MDGFSDIENSSSDVGSEVNEVETPDADFGDGDGVNDFDDTYESMNNGDETMEYSSENTESPEPVENNSEDTETAVDEQLNDFGDVDETTEQTETPDVAPAGDNVEQTPSNMTTDENVDEALSDFDDEDDTTETDTEDVEDETTEIDTAAVTDETTETDTDDVPDETAEDDTEDTEDETLESDIDEVTDKKTEGNTEDTADETSASSIDGSDDGNNEGTDSTSDTERDHTEKNAVFENVSYHQGQNDLGALGTCGPTSIANSLNRVTGSTEYSENKVLHNAMDNNLCHKSENPYSCGGTTTRDVVNIIDNVKNPDDNIHTEVYEYDKALSVEDLAKRLDDPGTVAMVGVDSATLWDQRGDVACSGLFQHTDSPSDHWITVDSPIRNEAGNLTGFNVIDSGGGVSEVSREKFEVMYMGDAGHTVSDSTAILISNSGDGGNTFATSEGVERTSNYKGSAVESDGNDPPKTNEIQSGVKNTECDKNGNELTDEAKEVNEKFRGDNFDASNSFEASFDDAEKKELVEKNASTTCGLNENLDGNLDGTKFAAIDKSSIIEAREKVPEVTLDTVMQKVIPSGQVENYLNGDWTQVRNCCSKASDTAPFVSCGSDAYKELRLDYKGNEGEGCNVRELESNSDLYVIRFTSDAEPSELGLPNDGHPCTGTGFTGSSEHLIPEYKYPATTPTDGAIYKIDAEGNETMVGMWDNDMKRFYPVP